MIECPNCHTPLEDGSRFCGNCGTSIPAPEEMPEPAFHVDEPVFETVFCPNCGEKNSTEFAFCQRCGTRLGEEPEPPAEKRGRPKLPMKKILLFGGIALAVIVVVLGAILLFRGGGAVKNSGAFYLKDKEITYKPASGKTETQVSSRLYGDSDDIGYYENYLGSYTYLCKDGKTFLYPDRWDSSDFSLYVRNIGSSKGDAAKIDSGVSYFYVNDGESIVTYRKSDKSLYQYSLKKQEKEKIVSEFQTLRVGRDGSVAYSDDDGNLYLKRVGKDKEKLASGITGINWISPDGKTVIYTKEDNLYRRESGKEQEKLASDVLEMGTVVEDGTFYYVKENEDKTLLDFVKDDKDLTDSQRRSIQEDLKDEDLSEYFCELYYFDGKESTMITDLFYSDTYAIGSSKKPLGFIQVLDEESFEPVRMSVFASGYRDGIEKLEAAFEESLVSYIADGSKLRPVEIDEVETVQFSSDGSKVWFLCDYNDERGEGELYEAGLSGSGSLKVEKLDSDVYDYLIAVMDSKVMYFKDCSANKTTGERTGELYIDRKKIESDVSVNRLGYSDKSKTVTYFTDYSDNEGTLNRYSGGKAVRVADDVYTAAFGPDGSVLYLSDYNTNRSRGDLWRFSGSKSVKIDEDVTRIITVRTAPKRK